MKKLTLFTFVTLFSLTSGNTFACGDHNHVKKEVVQTSNKIVKK